jgi:F-type H+-transporting ATPase subunit b
MQTTVAWLAHACEIVNKRGLAAATALVGCLLTAGIAAAQPADAARGTADAVHDAAHAGDAEEQAPHADTSAEAAHADEAHADDAHGGEHHEESIWVTLARVGNFALLAGGLFYFLRAPVAAHLASRGEQIRGDLATAARVKAEAAQRLAEIEQKLQALPAELELVKQRGAEEVAAEEARIAQQAEIERQRLVTQARREIDQQVRTARQALTAHAASLSIAAAREHLQSTLTDSDRQRLADEFTNQVGGVQ